MRLLLPCIAFLLAATVAAAAPTESSHVSMQLHATLRNSVDSAVQVFHHHHAAIMAQDGPSVSPECENEVMDFGMALSSAMGNGSRAGALYVKQHCNTPCVQQLFKQLKSQAGEKEKALIEFITEYLCKCIDKFAALFRGLNALGESMKSISGDNPGQICSNCKIYSFIRALYDTPSTCFTGLTKLVGADSAKAEQEFKCSIAAMVAVMNTVCGNKRGTCLYAFNRNFANMTQGLPCNATKNPSDSDFQCPASCQSGLAASLNSWTPPNTKCCVGNIASESFSNINPLAGVSEQVQKMCKPMFQEMQSAFSGRGGISNQLKSYRDGLTKCAKAKNLQLPTACPGSTQPYYSQSPCAPKVVAQGEISFSFDGTFPAANSLKYANLVDAVGNAVAKASGVDRDDVIVQSVSAGSASGSGSAIASGSGSGTDSGSRRRNLLANTATASVTITPRQSSSANASSVFQGVSSQSGKQVFANALNQQSSQTGLSNTQTQSSSLQTQAQPASQPPSGSAAAAAISPPPPPPPPSPPAPSSPAEKKKASGMSAGAKAGMAIGITAGVFVTAFFVADFYHRKKAGVSLISRMMGRSPSPEQELKTNPAI